jgi:hypothetical protein
MEWKPEAEQIRCVYTDDPMGAMPEHKGKVFAVVGPFETFTDKPALREALKMLLRGWNLQSESERK